MKNLISNTEFGEYLEVLEVSNSCYRMLRKNFDLFLKQLLELWMFVPCKLVDGVLVVLEEPEPIHTYGLDPDDYEYNDDEVIEFKIAKERCLFEGIEYVESKKENEYSFLRITELSPINYPKFWNDCTVEDLVKYSPRLTQTVLKQIGL